MIDRKVNKQPHPKNVVGTKSSPRMASMSESVPSQDTIRARAYELYENRGREAGQDEHDWLRAEQELLKQKR